MTEVRFGDNAVLKFNKTGAKWVTAHAERRATLYTRDGTFRIFDANELADEIRDMLLVHGLKQKLADKFSGIDDPADYLPAAVSVWEALVAGTWNPGRTERGPDPLLVQAIALITNQSEVAVRSKWETLSAAERKRLAANPKVLRKMAELAPEGPDDDEPLL